MHRASADALQFDYVREAAVVAVDLKYQTRLKEVYQLLAGMLTSWRVVDAVADAFVSVLVKPKKGKGAQSRGCKFFLLIDLADGIKPQDFMRQVVCGWSEHLDDDTTLDYFGWQQVQGDSNEFKDGICLIVGTNDDQNIKNLSCWLAEIGTAKISARKMFELFPSPTETVEA